MHHDAQQRIGEATQGPVMHGKAEKRRGTDKSDGNRSAKEMQSKLRLCFDLLRKGIDEHRRTALGTAGISKGSAWQT